MQKINVEKVRQNESKSATNLIDKIGNREIAVVWKLVVWAPRAWWRWQKLEHIYETAGSDSMFAFTASTSDFWGANARYRPLWPHLHIWVGVRHMKDPSFQTSLSQSCEGTLAEKVACPMGTIWSKVPYDKV